MDELDKLVKQVEILSQTVELLTNRLDQLYQLNTERLDQLSKMLLEQSTLSLKRDEDLKNFLDRGEILEQARTDSLSDLDRVTDDLATATAALLQFQKGQQQTA